MYPNDLITRIDLNDPMNEDNKQGMSRLGIHLVREYANNGIRLRNDRMVIITCDRITPR